MTSSSSVPARHLPALLQLASAGLPVGAFSHSLGLEAALEANVVSDVASAERWIADYLALAWAQSEAPLWRAQFTAWQAGDSAAIGIINDQLLAMRETTELRMECEQTGRSMALWLQALPQMAPWPDAQRTMLAGLHRPAYASVHACAAVALGLDERAGLYALGWSLAENLTTAAVKLVPLGQVAGQGILRRVSSQLPAWIDEASALTPAQAGNFTPMLAILSAHHETQYTRLFRS